MDIVFKPESSTYSMPIPAIPSESFEKLVEQFLALFPNRSGSMVKRNGTATWRQMSRYHDLSDKEIMDSVAEPATLFRAIAVGTKTSVFVLRIPKTSPYHNVEGAQLLREVLSRVDLKVSHYEFEEHWYFYLFLAEATNTRKLADRITEGLESAHFVVGEGMIEAVTEGEHFPLPLQDGFTWFDKKCNSVVTRKELSLEDALRLFICDADHHRNLWTGRANWHDLSEEEQHSTQEIFEQILPGAEPSPDIALSIWPVSASA